MVRVICSSINKVRKLSKLASVVILGVCLFQSITSVAEDSPTPPESLLDRHARSTVEFKRHLKTLARQCQAVQQHALAARIERFYPDPMRDTLFLFRPSDEYLESPDTPETQTFRTVRREHGQFLMQLAQEAATTGHAGFAISLLYEALYCDGDLAIARQILGQKKWAGRWVSAQTAARLEQNERWSDRFGWLPEIDLERYELGERLYRGKWISEQEDVRRHRQMRNGWKVNTDHYEVTTNLSLEAGVELAQKLEAFYTVWSQLFAGYYLSPQSLEKRFRRVNEDRGSPEKYKVYYFRNRAEYDVALARIQPGIAGKTLGVYLEKIKTAYFFAPSADNEDEKDLSQITVWHEATHQLFAERISTRKVSGLKNNFWIVEGIACFMETLQNQEQGWTLGGPMAGRLPAARIRLERDRFYIPFAEVVNYGARALLSNPQYRTLYTQAAGQAAFLMTAGDGRFRPATVDYLRRVYRGRAKLDTLEALTGRPLTTLDQDYREFLFQTSAE